MTKFIKSRGISPFLLVLFFTPHLAFGAPPDTLGIPIMKSTSDLHELSNRIRSEATPKELNQLISKLKPRQGKLDPVVMDMLSAFDRTYRDTNAAMGGGNSAETTYVFPDDTVDTRMASSTEENGIIWRDTTNRPRKRERDNSNNSNRFSSRYRSANFTTAFGNDYVDVNFGNESQTANETEYKNDHIPFNHINDPNLRNHRLYDWEFETYKNFTHIDQAEDLMADEDRASETKVSVVAAPPPPNQQEPSPSASLSSLDKVEIPNSSSNKGDPGSIPNLWPVKSNGSKSKRVRVKGIPHIVISLEDTSSDHGYDAYSYQVPGLSLDSGERGLYQRPREPLRQSSTENIVYVHGSSGEVPYTEVQPGRRSPTSAHPQQQFRPSSVDIANDVFVDPDQDFFTSTLRSTDQHEQFHRPLNRRRSHNHQHHNRQAEQQHDISSETLPKRRRKKLKKMDDVELVNGDEGMMMASNIFSTRVGSENGEGNNEENQQRTRGSVKRGRGSVRYSPVYSRNNVQGTKSSSGSGSTTGQERERARASSSSGPVHGAESQTSDRIAYPTGGGSGNQPELAHDQYAMSYQAQQQQYLQQQQEHAMNHPVYDTTGAGAGSHHLHDGGIGNYYSLHNDHHQHQSHLGLGPSGSSAGVDHLQNSYGYNKHPLAGINPNHQELTSTEYMGGHMNRLQNALSALNIFGNQNQQSQQSQVHPTKKLQPAMADQVIAPGNIDDFYHPYAASDHQVNQFYEDSYYTSWSNTWFILAGLIAFTAIFALLLPTLLSSQRHGKKDVRFDLDEEDINTSTSDSNNYYFDNSQNDMGQHSDIWGEIKGVYNDLVNLFRGDYSLLQKLKQPGPEGPKIVYRDDREDDDMSSDDEDEEDDEKSDNSRVTLRNRKRQQFLKKQKKLMQKQQQQNKLKQQTAQQGQGQKPQPQANPGQPKSNMGRDEKTLLSKSKADMGQGNQGKTINASSVNNLVVVSGPGNQPPEMLAREAEPEPTATEQEVPQTNSPRAVTGFVLPEHSTLATIPFLNLTGYGGVNGLQNSFLSEWAQVQLINNH